VPIERAQAVIREAKLRRKLTKAAAKYGLSDPRTVRISAALDQVLLARMRLCPTT